MKKGFDNSDVFVNDKERKLLELVEKNEKNDSIQIKGED